MKNLLLFTTLIGLATLMSAQEKAATGIPMGEREPAPATLSGQAAPRGLLLERSSPNYVVGGFSVTQMYTDNVELTENGVSDLSWNIEPYISLSHSSPRLVYALGIHAGFTANRTLHQRNQATQTAALDLSYALGRFTTLRFSDTFANSNGLWSGRGTQATDAGSGIGPIQQPNPASYTYGEYRSNTVLAELSRQLTVNGSGGIRGTYSITWFPNSASSPTAGRLYGGQTYSAEAFYNHRLSSRQWVGVTARAQRFDVTEFVGRTDALSALFLYAINIRPTLNIAFFGGPELSMTSAPSVGPVPVNPFPRRMWSPAVGTVFSWQQRRTGVLVSWARQTSDGAGLGSASTSSSANASLSQLIGRHLEAGIGIGYTDSEPIVTRSTIRTYSEFAQLTYRVRETYAFSGGYSRNDQTAIATSTTMSANRVWVSVSIGFLRPIGR